jgi:rhodanese-related sulfurtransferase
VRQGSGDRVKGPGQIFIAEWKREALKKMRGEMKHDPSIRMRWALCAAGLILIAALGACSKQQAPPAPWKTIDAQTLRSMMDPGKDIAVVDTMSEIECLDHRIPGTTCISCEQIEDNASALPADKGRALVFYCDSEDCYQSRRAADAAIRYGYRDVYLLAGGMPAWKQSGYPVESADRIPRMPIVSVKAPELTKMLAERKDLLLIDIRSEKSFREGHIDGAINIPLYQLSRRYDEIPLDRTVVLIDDRGFRTFLAGSYLERKGLKVMRLFAGMRGWQEMIAGKS